MKKFIVGLVFLLLPLVLLPQSEQSDADWYETTATDAIKKENYDYAVKILKQGIKKFPQEAALNRRLAELYFDKKLYPLALNEYLATDRKAPGDFDTMDRVQTCYSLLNDEETAITYLQNMLEEFPMDSHSDSYYAVQDLGWLYYKTYRLKKAETLLLEHLALRGKDQSKRSLRMTLATIYSGMYAYKESEEHYLASIEEALDYEDTYFAAVAYYNLSLLEMDFYNFNSAIQYTELSLQNYDRPTGHLARGELYQMQLDYANARREYEKGLELENTPMTNINLAILFSNFGLLDSALAYAKEVYNSRDLSWIANFGTDKQEHIMEMHEILADIYQGLTHREKLLPKESPGAGIVSFFRSIWFGLNEYYHRQNYKSLALRTGKAMLQEHKFLDAYMLFYEANRDYRKVALKYLNLAREYELALAPQAEAYYLMEEGELLKSSEKLQQARDKFDPVWEKKPLFRTLLAQSTLEPKATTRQRQLLSQAYSLNPGGLLAAGFGVPLRLELELSGNMQKRRNWLQRALKKAGSQLMAPEEGRALEEGYRYRLRLSWNEGEKPSFKFSDQQTGRLIAAESIDPGEGSPRVQTYRFVRRLLKEYIYRPQDS